MQLPRGSNYASLLKQALSGGSYRAVSLAAFYFSDEGNKNEFKSASEAFEFAMLVCVLFVANGNALTVPLSRELVFYTQAAYRLLDEGTEPFLTATINGINRARVLRTIPAWRSEVESWLPI